MLFICDQNGPVDKTELGLPNNPESEQLRPVLERFVGLWNLRNPGRRLKIFSADDAFPFDRWDSVLFDLLPVAKAAAVPAPVASEPRQVMINGTPYSVRETAVIGYFNWNDAARQFFVSEPHGIPGNIKTQRKILSARLIVYNPWDVQGFPVSAPVQFGTGNFPAQMESTLPCVVFIDDTRVYVFRNQNSGTGDLGKDIHFIVLIEHVQSSLTFPAIP